MVPFGYTSTLHNKKGFGGSSIFVEGRMWTDKHQTMQCIDLYEGTYHFSNEAQSLEVTKMSVYGETAKNYWIPIASDSGTYLINYGFFTWGSNPSLYKLYLTHQMRYYGTSMIRLGLSATETANIVPYEMATILHDNLVTMDFGLVHEYVTCPLGESGEVPTLWQHVTMTADTSSTIYSSHVVCRYGENAAVSPQCPWSACLDSECTECHNRWWVSN